MENRKLLVLAYYVRPVKGESNGGAFTIPVWFGTEEQLEPHIERVFRHPAIVEEKWYCPMIEITQPIDGTQLAEICSELRKKVVNSFEEQYPELFAKDFRIIQQGVNRWET